jgi:DNA-binding NtrC family response regulator
LFGHDSGIRGDSKLRKGKFEYASGGTLYLDDVGALPSTLQDEVLGVLEDGQVTRQGEHKPISVDVRVIAASRHNLLSLSGSQFCRELRSRLARQIIALPALCQRAGDLEKLVTHFLKQEAALAGKRRIPALAAECWSKLQAHSWPGNVRELQTVISKAVGSCRGPKILARDLSLDEPNPEPYILAGLRIAISSALSSHQSPLYDLLYRMFCNELEALTLTECGGNVREAEKRLGVSLEQLRNPVGPHREDEPLTGKLTKGEARQYKAVMLIKAYPHWTVRQYADELECSQATLYRDEVIQRALEMRKNDRRPPRGH